MILYICLISTNAVTENNLTQNAVSLKELWKKRQGAKNGYGVSSDVKDRCT